MLKNKINLGSLIGTYIEIFVEGGHRLRGTLENYDERQIILRTFEILGEGTIIMERDKVYGVLIYDENEEEDSIEHVSSMEYDIDEEPEGDGFPLYSPEENDLGPGNQYGSILPADMLEGEDDEPVVSFSVSMSSLYNSQANERESGNDSDKKA